MAPRKKPAKKASKAATKRPNKPEPAPKPRGQKQLTRIELFAREYLLDLNGRQAAIRAGYSPQSARITASELLARADVQEAVAKAMEERAARTGITADRVLERLWAIATADPRELIELHRSCCRYCYGADHRYQRTPREMAEDRTAHEGAELVRQSEGKPPHVFDDAGGLGWDPRRDPHPECPECFGEGVERVVPKDTRDLSPTAKLLYAGVKTTQHGLEIRTHSQTDMLVNVGKHLGLFRDKIELTGKNGGPMETKSIGAILDELGEAGADTGPGASS